MPHSKILNNFGKEIKLKGNGYFAKVFVSPLNKRIRVIKHEGPNIKSLIENIDKLASENNFVSKIFMKVKVGDVEPFINMGYENEGTIREYFNGQDAIVISKYTVKSRKDIPKDSIKLQRKVEEVLKKCKIDSIPQMPEGYTIKIAKEKEDFINLAKLYKTVYQSYPFPIFNWEYLESTSKSHIIYGLVFDIKGSLVAAASSEMNIPYKNSEMTDFATMPSHRGKSLAYILLKYLEEESKKIDIKSFYTIARSHSIGMNKVFKKSGYQFTGKLINNCHISGNFETMNIWCKKAN